MRTSSEIKSSSCVGDNNQMFAEMQPSLIEYPSVFFQLNNRLNWKIALWIFTDCRDKSLRKKNNNRNINTQAEVPTKHRLQAFGSNSRSSVKINGGRAIAHKNTISLLYSITQCSLATTLTLFHFNASQESVIFWSMSLSMRLQLQQCTVNRINKNEFPDFSLDWCLQMLRVVFDAISKPIVSWLPMRIATIWRWKDLVLVQSTKLNTNKN